MLNEPNEFYTEEFILSVVLDDCILIFSINWNKIMKLILII